MLHTVRPAELHTARLYNIESKYDFAPSSRRFTLCLGDPRCKGVIIWEDPIARPKSGSSLRRLTPIVPAEHFQATTIPTNHMSESRCIHDVHAYLAGDNSLTITSEFTTSNNHIAAIKAPCTHGAPHPSSHSEVLWPDIRIYLLCLSEL